MGVRRLAALFLVVLLCGLVPTAVAQLFIDRIPIDFPPPRSVDPDTLKWAGGPAGTGLKFAWAIGSEAAPAPYVLLVRIAPGGRIPTHTHPDTRIVTVLSGTVHFGYGNGDEPNRWTYRAGATYVVTGRMPHTVWAEKDSVEYQEVGFGPTGTEFVKR